VSNKIKVKPRRNL